MKKGFTLVEVLVGSAIFLTVSVAAYSAFVSIFKLAAANQANITAVALADEQFEIIRNMPYTSVGLTNGIPLGILQQNQTVVRGGFTYNVGLTIRNINLATTTLQASDKLVEATIACTSCQNFSPIILTGQISPANLQSASTGGALVVQVFDSNGVPVPDATVVVQSTATSSVTNTDVTNVNGILQIIGVPQGTNMYRITVSKSGYSTDRTYLLGGSGNPNPTKPDVTVLNQQVSQVSFAIDRVSTLNFSSVTALCTAVPSYDFSMVGSKQIGDAPTVVKKYSQSLATNGSGALSLNSMEWDSYAITPTDTAYDLAGINPLSPLVLNPGNSQKVQFVVVPKSGNSLMVSVLDSATGLPLSDATVQLSGGSYNQAKTTGQGYLSQTDWSGGSGQANFTDETRYAADNGNANVSTSTGNIVLNPVFGFYNTNATATLESSSFDTGTTSNFYTFNWTPIGQPTLAGASPVKFQFASASTSAGPWSYLGPDGTADTYFSVPGSSINAASNGNEFARYLAYLTTRTATVTPMISDVSFAYTSSCIPPGQVIFQGLAAGIYTLSVTKSGYTAYSNSSINIASGWQNQTVIMAP